MAGGTLRGSRNSHDPGLPKTVITAPLRIGSLATDDHVVQQLDVHRPGRIAHLAGDLHIRRTGSRSPLG